MQAPYYVHKENLLNHDPNIFLLGSLIGYMFNIPFLHFEETRQFGSYLEVYLIKYGNNYYIIIDLNQNVPINLFYFFNNSFMYFISLLVSDKLLSGINNIHVYIFVKYNQKMAIIS